MTIRFRRRNTVYKLGYPICYFGRQDSKCERVFQTLWTYVTTCASQIRGFSLLNGSTFIRFKLCNSTESSHWITPPGPDKYMPNMPRNHYQQEKKRWNVCVLTKHYSFVEKWRFLVPYRQIIVVGHKYAYTQGVTNKKREFVLNLYRYKNRLI